MTYDEDELNDAADEVLRSDPSLHWDRNRGLIYERARKLLDTRAAAVSFDAEVFAELATETRELFERRGYTVCVNTNHRYIVITPRPIVAEEPRDDIHG